MVGDWTQFGWKQRSRSTLLSLSRRSLWPVCDVMCLRIYLRMWISSMVRNFFLEIINESWGKGGPYCEQCTPITSYPSCTHSFVAYKSLETDCMFQYLLC